MGTKTPAPTGAGSGATVNAAGSANLVPPNTERNTCEIARKKLSEDSGVEFGTNISRIIETFGGLLERAGANWVKRLEGFARVVFDISADACPIRFGRASTIPKFHDASTDTYPDGAATRVNLDEVGGRQSIAHRLECASRFTNTDPSLAIAYLVQACGCRRTLGLTWCEVLGVPEIGERDV